MATTKTVKYWEPGFDKPISIPENELAPGAMMVRVEGMEGEGAMWTSGDAICSVQPGPKQHETSPELEQACALIRQSLADVYPMTQQEWVDGFLRDLHMWREVGLWLRASDAYVELSTNIDNPTHRKDLFRCVAASMFAPRREKISDLVDAEVMTREEVEAVTPTIVSTIWPD